MANRKVSWTPEEDAMLLSMKGERRGWIAVASALHKGVQTCKRRALEKGWTFPPAASGFSSHQVLEYRPWSREEEKTLKTLVGLGIAWDVIGKKIGRTAQGCRQYWQRNRLTSHFLVPRRKYASRKVSQSASRAALILEKSIPKNGGRWKHLEGVIESAVLKALAGARLQTELLSATSPWYDRLINFIWKSFLIIFAVTLLAKGAYELSLLLFPL